MMEYVLIKELVTKVVPVITVIIIDYLISKNS